MMELMDRITDKPGWDTKIFEASIASKWKSEALATPEVDISEKMVDWVSRPVIPLSASSERQNPSP